ncbi:MAG: DUF6056 family protein [Erysipelotrichaceae bacterium]|nr:DUF6056 family protein [Erysipelotrichaceae bacterium]
MKYLKQHRDIFIIGVFSIFIMFFFLYISYLTPLAGDDWGYAVMGRNGNPFMQAFKLYLSWSGRYFSELFGLIMTNNKWLWNIVNSIMFTAIFYGIVKLFNKNIILICFTVIALIFSVPNILRIETYTFIMGNTYVVPLVFIIIYINIVKRIIFESKEFKKSIFYLCLALNIYIPLCIENIAAILGFLNVLIVIYCFFSNKKLLNKFIIILFVSILGIAILRLSPGSTYRLLRDNPEWKTLSIFNKISINWLNFLNYTFVKNNYLIFTLSTVLILFSFKHNKLLIPFYFLGVIVSISQQLFSKTNINFLKMFFDIFYSRSAVLFLTVFYLIYIISIFYLLRPLKKDKYFEGITYLMLAGTGNLVMLISPIYGARSSLYTVYFLIIFICFILSIIDINNKLFTIMVFGFSTLTFLKINEYLYKYRLVNDYMKIRNMEIEYYVNNPDVKEAWLIRMPETFIHSADIEEWDTNHMEVFKAYYGINPDMKLIFYKK